MLIGPQADAEGALDVVHGPLDAHQRPVAEGADDAQPVGAGVTLHPRVILLRRSELLRELVRGEVAMEVGAAPVVPVSAPARPARAGCAAAARCPHAGG